MNLSQNKEFLVKLAHYKMPFGKYKDRYLTKLPEAYLVWFYKKGFPDGNLGKMMEAAYEIKINGLEAIIENIRNQYP
ncbi:DUF3820 family protein [Ascidiimonas sp. W6]|uniref:DUF3820 family protein n=1 Tax=Ascidiimonas meishanensis TaxID=3128903 RepID=UPI0030EF22F2